MGKYTLEIREIVEGGGVIFPFEYDFYEPTLQKNFEQKFLDHYYFNEIGFESIERFWFNLTAKLNTIMPYYHEMYQTIVASKDVNFLYNKDLKETTTRNISSTSDMETNYIEQTTATSDNKASDIENGNSSVTLEPQNLTSVSENNGQNSTNADTTNSGNSVTTETHEFLSQGNIGVTTTGDLLIAWRESIVNIDNLIFEECRELFMQIY